MLDITTVLHDPLFAQDDILRPPLANDRLKFLDDGNVRLDFKKPWSDGMTCSQCLLWMR